MDQSWSVVGPVLLLAVLVLLAGASLRLPPPGHVLVLSRRGVVRRVAAGGPLWRVPGLDRVEAIPLVGDPLAVSVRATTRDGREVRVLAEAAAPVAHPMPGERADTVVRARLAAEDELAEDLLRAVADRDVAELDRVAVDGLEVVELDLVLGPAR